MTGARTALVIGGGIAGPVAAMALRQAGIEATVYEARQRSAENVGAFLTLASNGIDALRTIGADHRPLAVGFPTPGITLRSTSGKTLGVARAGIPLPDGTTSHTLKRADLYAAIHNEATARGVAIEHRKRLIDVERSGDGVRAVFEDGSQAAGDLLIGADGIHSVVRKLIDPKAPAPSYGGLVNVGGYARDVDVDATPGTYTMIFGKRAFFGYVVTPGGEVWWFANVPRRDEPSRGEVEAIAAEEWQRHLGELFAGDAGPAVRLVQATDTTDMVTATPVHSIPHLPVWHSDRMVVIGDAAHAPTPTSGQGASLAIEDAVVLAGCLREAAEPPQALARFEALRRTRVERIIRVAARINANKASGPLARSIRDALLPFILKVTSNTKPVTEPFDYHIDWSDPIFSVTGEPMGRTNGS